MIVYKKTKKEFLDDVFCGEIDTQIQASFVRETGHSTGKSELNSWRDSMQYMNKIMLDSEIPNDVGVAIEYHIPQTTKRIDFIITGMDHNKHNSAIIIELKQWSDGISVTDKDGIVNTNFFGEVSHPSYQAWSYATLLTDYNSSIEDSHIQLKPCAFLHNYLDNNIILNSFYQHYIDEAPVFFKSDAAKLQDFIKKFVKYGDKGELLYSIENGKIRPSKALADSLLSMLEGNKEFILIDDQKIVYETAIKYAKDSTELNKNVLIVEGGPGTGKSVVAINLLAELTRKGLNARYVTKNSAPREVYQIKLSGKFTKSRIANLFSSSGSFYQIEANIFDALIVDEAHRLNEKSGLFSNLGNNQVMELINASKFSVFFVDEDQRVTLKDIGKKSVIEDWAKKLGINVTNLKLSSQFRCNGSDGYLAWIDDILQISDTANDTLEGIDYDFKVIDTPNELHKLIVDKNTNNKSRIVAGYCWNWISKKDDTLHDIKINDYSAKWNLNSHGQAWIIHPDSAGEVGCIHTCQGLELDYVGVIIGPDLIVRNGVVITDHTKRASTDQSLRGLNKLILENKKDAFKKADMIIKNTYRTLMTRGMKGCYVYSTDPETQEYFRNKIHLTEDTSTETDYLDGAMLNIDQ